MFHINFADDWNRTADLWYLNRPLYQLSHNHCQLSHRQYQTCIQHYQTCTKTISHIQTLIKTIKHTQRHYQTCIQHYQTCSQTISHIQTLTKTIKHTHRHYQTCIQHYQTYRHIHSDASSIQMDDIKHANRRFSSFVGLGIHRWTIKQWGHPKKKIKLGTFTHTRVADVIKLFCGIIFYMTRMMNSCMSSHRLQKSTFKKVWKIIEA